jgi:hypothetical protein
MDANASVARKKKNNGHGLSVSTDGSDLDLNGAWADMAIEAHSGAEALSKLERVGCGD